MAGQPVQGNRQHDNTDRGSPVKIGGKASSSTPTAVAADDRVDAYFDTTGRLVVKAETAAGGDIGGGTEYTEDAAAAADPIGKASILVRKDTPATLVSADGDNVAQRGTNYGAAYTQVVTSAGAFVDTFGGGTQYTEADIDATITGTAVMWEDAADTLRAASAAKPLPVTANLAAGTNNIGDVDVLTVPAPLSTTGGGTEATALRVTVANDSTGVVSVDDNAGSLTVDAVDLDIRNLSSGQDSVDTELTTADLDTGVGTDTRAVVGIAGAASGGAQLIDGTSANGLEVDVTRIAAGDNNIGNVDIVTVPAPLSTTGGGTEATALRVTLANDSTGLVSVDDNGGSLTVDGTVSVSGAVDTELPAAATLADNAANPTAPAVGAFGMVWDGATWDRAAGTSADGALVNLGANNDVTVTSGTITANQGTAGTAWEVVGDVAQDAALGTHNPIIAGGRASTAVPTAMSADGDAVSMWANRSGAQVITQAPHVGLNSDPWNLVHEAAQYTTTQTSAVLVAGGVSEKLVVTKVQIQAGGTTAGTLQLYFGTGAFVRGTNRAIFDGEFAPSATLKPGVVMDGPFIAGANGDDLMVTTSAAINPLTINVWYYTVS